MGLPLRVPCFVIAASSARKSTADTQVDPSKLSSVKNIQQGSSMVNRFAKRDPALYPLAFIMVGIAGVTGYFFVSSHLSALSCAVSL